MDNQQIIEIVTRHLNEQFSEAAEPLWEDNDGIELRTDPGCVDWTVCEYFNILLSPPPEVDESDENSVTVTIQAEVYWSHWEDILVVREFQVNLKNQDSEWVVINISWEDVDEKQLLGDGGDV